MAALANYPNQPINFIVPYGAGEGVDSRSRQISQLLTQVLKVPITIDKKPGAGGNIGTELIDEVFLENESSMLSEGMKLYFFPKLLSNIQFRLVRR